MSPEEKARLVIDKKLKASGYAVQDVKEFNPMAACGVVVREWQTTTGPCDYLIFIDGTPCGLIEAKEHDKGEKLTAVAEQTRRYAESEFKYARTPFERFRASKPCRFCPRDKNETASLRFRNSLRICPRVCPKRLREDTRRDSAARWTNRQPN